MTVSHQTYDLTDQELEAFFLQKYGKLSEIGWSPKIRYEFKYYLPGDIYEALVGKLVRPGISWIDIGGGNAIFPHNPVLSRELADRAGALTAIDPSPNIHENPYADNKQQCLIENFNTEKLYDLATFRMVAEHVENPNSVLEKLSTIIKPGGAVVIYTVNKFCPIPIVAKIMPYWTHFKIIRLITGGGEQRHIFPVFYKMNSRKTLKDQFEAHGFTEDYFVKLDDLSTTIDMELLHRIDNRIRKFLNAIYLKYPEFNLLGVYRKQA